MFFPFMDDLINVCKFFGPQSVLFLSNDDKARVPLGLAAASLQASILMHMEFKVSLPDHNFVLGSRRALRRGKGNILKVWKMIYFHINQYRAHDKNLSCVTN